MITIVIPYYQRTLGILSRAIRSVINQSLEIPITLIVVDDGSPVPACADLRGIRVPDNVCVQIIHRINGGPGAARNTGLESAPLKTKYLAFLDSDDEWTKDHLQNAITALDRGYDFYFSDFYQLGQTVSAFARAGKIDIANHEPLDGEPQLFAYVGSMLNQIIMGNIIGTSTVVYDFQKFPEIRFREDLKSAGEDYLFWIELAKRGARFVFSTRQEAIYGKGVNVYSGAKWGSVEILRRIQNELEYRKSIEKVVSLNQEQQDFVKGKITELRESFLRALLQYMRHTRRIPLSLIWSQIGRDAKTLLLLPRLIAHKTLGFNRSKS